MPASVSVLTESQSGTIKVRVTGVSSDLAAIRAAEKWYIEEEGGFIRYYVSRKFSGGLGDSIFGNFSEVTKCKEVGEGFNVTFKLANLKWEHYDAAGHTLAEYNRMRKYLGENLNGLKKGKMALNRHADLAGLGYKVKKVAAKIRAAIRGKKPKRTTKSPSSPSNSTTVPTKKTPAKAKPAAKKKKPATAKASTTAAAARRKPRAKTKAQKAEIAAKAARTRKRNKGQMRTAEPKRQKSVVQYPYKKVELRHEWEAKGFGIDKEVSKSANAVRLGIKGSGGHLRHQSVLDKKSRMRRGSLAGTPTKAKTTRTKKVGAAKKNPNWKPTAAQTRNLPAAMIKGLRKYHTGK